MCINSDYKWPRLNPLYRKSHEQIGQTSGTTDCMFLTTVIIPGNGSNRLVVVMDRGRNFTFINPHVLEDSNYKTFLPMVNFFKFLFKENEDGATQHMRTYPPRPWISPPGTDLPIVPTIPLPITIPGVQAP